MKYWKISLLSVYSALIVWVLLFKFSLSPQAAIEAAINGENRVINLIPFKASGGTREIIMNCLVFFPFGMFLGMREGRY